jgi:hypothetical protein
MLCPCCPDTRDAFLTERLRVLQLLALVEHPEALPVAEKLRLSREILAWLEQNETGLRCDRYAATGPSRAARRV